MPTAPEMFDISLEEGHSRMIDAVAMATEESRKREEKKNVKQKKIC